jgi:hypothetical protein
MASGGHVDRIAAEFGVHFIRSYDTAKGPHQSKARRTCQNLLAKHGPEHLRQVLGLLNSPLNRGCWSQPFIKAVSDLALKKPDWLSRKEFVEVFDALDLRAIHASAKRVDASAVTATMCALLIYEVGKRIEKERDAA